jgi:hypothetical protein
MDSTEVSGKDYAGGEYALQTVARSKCNIGICTNTNHVNPIYKLGVMT